jgi:DNA-binding MarR family transcriptional regulator
MNRKLPNNSEIGQAIQEIRSREYIYISAFAHAVNRFVSIIAKKSRLNRTCMVFLTELVVRGGSLQPTQLSRLMYISKYSVTKIIDKLEKNGYVVRQHFSKDHRVVHVRVTSAGLEFVSKTLNTHDLLWQNIMSTLSENEHQELNRSMKKMTHAFPKQLIDGHLDV